MKLERRRLFGVLLAVFVVVLTAAFLLEGEYLRRLFSPLATALWLFLRIFFLGIDQQVYWQVAILAGVLVLFYRLNLGGKQPAAEETRETSMVVEDVNFWRISFKYAASEPAETNLVRKKLTEMLVSLYLSRQTDTTYLEVYEMLAQRQIPLPEEVYAFLFESPSLGRRWFWRLRRRARRWTGREAADFNRAVNQVLAFMETSLEMKNDNR